MSVAAQESAAAPEVNTRQVMGAVVASCLGWALDLFDLFVLLYVAPVVGIRVVRGDPADATARLRVVWFIR
jgi:hypothetical protein